MINNIDNIISFLDNDLLIYGEYEAEDDIEIIKGTLTKDIPCIKGISDITGVGGCYIGLNLGISGDITINQHIPCVNDSEIYDFENESVKFYKYRISEKMYALLVRGALSFNMIPDAFIYPDGRWGCVAGETQAFVKMFQSDTMTGKITAMRILWVPFEVRYELWKIFNLHLENGYTTYDCAKEFIKLSRISPDELEKNATLIGVVQDDLVPKKILMGPGYTWATK